MPAPARFVLGLGVLLAFAAAGQALASGLKLPLPGPVLGLALLWAALALRLVRLHWIEDAADGLLGVLGLLFVPATVGFVQFLGAGAAWALWLLVLTAGLLLAFGVGVLAQTRAKTPLANPTLVATLLVAGALLVLAVPYAHYAQAVQPLTSLLAPAVVALAAPLYRHRALLRRQWQALGLGGALGTGLAVAADAGLAHLLNLAPEAQRALLTAPATSPVALQLAPLTYAPPALAATLAVLSGLVGALVLPSVLTRLGVGHPLARGVALGAVAHGIGTARAREEHAQSGAAASVGMGLAALLVTGLVGLLTRLGG
ncbi:LrgB family protein [Deinococcus arboris]|uniref:LrgB family protein n=1 Tax=Deinococcus arboris TaxID=2682977 RepID=UPI0034E20162